jgi:cytochrome c oxidase subunit 2
MNRALARRGGTPRRFRKRLCEFKVGFAPVRRTSVFQLVMIGLAAAAISTATAVAVPWLPEEASREAGRIAFTFWFATVISLVVFSGVVAVIVYAYINFRVPENDFSEDGPPIHGNTRLEIFWTTVPFILVTMIAIVSAIVLSEDGDAGTNPLKVTVIGQQFAWTFEYPNGQIYPTLHVPVGRKLLLDITSRDVIHSFWVPQWAQKQDAVPGINTRLVVTPDRTGIFPVICVELCGLGHALMRSEAIVMPPAAYSAWYKSNTTAAPSLSTSGGVISTAAATQIFTTNGCIACHTFSAIPGATGKVGPALNSLKAVAASLHEPLTTFITTAIVDPYKHIPAGYQPHVMPDTFGTTIPKAQLSALVQYLAAHTH